MRHLGGRGHGGARGAGPGGSACDHRSADSPDHQHERGCRPYWGERDDSAAGMELQPDAFSDAPHATVLLAHENVLLRMSSPGAIAPPFPVEMWPTVLLCYLR